MSTPFDDARAALYVAPTSEFVARRKELAAQLKAKGDPAGAKLLGALPKPSAHAWIVNRLFADGALDAVFAAGTDSRAAQAALMRGESDPATAKKAQDAHRALVAAAAARARDIVDGSDTAATPALSAKVSSLVLAITLRGSFAPYPDGCLAGDVELPSLEELASGLVVASPTRTIVAGAGAIVRNDTTPAPPVVAPVDDDAERVAAAERARARAEAERALVAAEAAAADAQAALHSANERRVAADADVARARAALDDAEATARTGLEAVTEAQRAVDARAAGVAAARAALDAVPA